MSSALASPPTSGAAAVLADFGQDLEVRELQVPPPEPGALVVEVVVSSVCGSDVHTWRGAVNPLLPINLPIVLGHEIVGRIVAIGPGADTDSVGQALRVGDRVVWEHAACGRCTVCTVEMQPTLCPNRKVGMFQDTTQFPYMAGGFAQYSYVWPGAGRLRVPDTVDSDEAAVASCALRSVVSAFDSLGSIDHLSTVVIQGSGPLGLFATAMAARHRPKKLIVVGAPDQRLDLAKKWGADETVSVEALPDPADRLAAVEELTDGGPNVLLELSGAPGAFAEGVSMAARNARYVVVGTLGGADQPVTASRIVSRGLRITGSFGAEIGSYYSAMEFLDAARADHDWSELFSGRRYSLSEATDALRSLHNMTEIKPLIDPWA